MCSQGDCIKKHVSRYDKHMPDTDDVSLIILKGHLLIEEMLVDIRDKLLPNTKYFDSTNISFNQLVCVIRSGLKSKHEHSSWDLIIGVNKLRNQLVHNLEPRDIGNRLSQLFDLYGQTQPFDEIYIEKSGETKLDTTQRLRHVIVDCMQFLLSILSLFNEQGKQAS
jgi:hypothetical protein